MNNQCKIAKVCSVLVLISLFFWNNMLIFIHYYEGKTVTSSQITPTNGTQTMPAIFVCRENSFSDYSEDMSNLDNFLSNTLDLNYTIWSMNPNYEVHDSNSTDFKVEHVYSYSRGHCYAFKYIKKVIKKGSNRKIMRHIIILFLYLVTIVGIVTIFYCFLD